jgi:ATP-binding cassette, subfamily B, bacterial CvaB/MchF/RaxB
MRPILQSEAAECGVACLGMVASHHGLNVDLYDLRQRFGLSLKGATLAQLIRYAERLGFTSRALRLDLDHLNQLKTPAILHWGMNHFVVLAKVSGKTVTILDPAAGERKLSLVEFSEHFTGVALELTPTSKFKPADDRRKIKLSDLWGKVSGLWRSLAQIILLAICLEVFAIVAPLFNQFIVDEAIQSGDRELLQVITIGFALLLAFQAALGFARSWLVMRFSTDLGLQWSVNVFAHLVRLPVAWFERRHLGDIVSRFGSIQTIKQTVTGSLIEAMLDGLMAVAAAVMILIYSWKLALVVFAAATIYGLLRWALYYPLKQATQERLLMAAKESSHFLETMRAIQAIRLFSTETERRARWQNLLVDVINRDVSTQKLAIGFKLANTITFGVENLLIFYIAALLIMDSTFTVGMLFAFVSYKVTFTSRISALFEHITNIKMLSLHAERLSDIALTEPEQNNVQENDLDHLQPSIELRNVSFRYGEGEPWVLDNVNLKIEAGQNVAMTGPSGCGKTTLLKVMLGILKPEQGDVLYGGQRVEQIGLINFRRVIGTVMQEDSLLSGSLAENISFFDTIPDMARVEAAAKLAAVDDDIKRFPMGYQTLVGDMGSTLSGGQKQRLFLARALYKKPRILALDEATSHLDLFNEQRVNDALARLKLTRTIIAHRPETIRSAQRVFIMDGGKVHELKVESTSQPQAVAHPDVTRAQVAPI